MTDFPLSQEHGILVGRWPKKTISFTISVLTASSRVIMAGDYKHGLDFQFDRDFKNGDVKSLRNYLMKYLTKTFVESIPEWTLEELVFNAIAWKDGFDSSDAHEICQLP